MRLGVAHNRHLLDLRANPAKVEDFGGARDQEKGRPVFRPITRQLKVSITFITSDRSDLK